MAATNSKLRLALKIASLVLALWYFVFFIISIVALASMHGYYLLGVMSLLLSFAGLACSCFAFLGSNYHPVTKRDALIYTVVSFLGYAALALLFVIMACLSWGLIPTVESAQLMSTDELKKFYSGLSKKTLDNPTQLLITVRNMMSTLGIFSFLSTLFTGAYLGVFTIHMSPTFVRRYWIFSLGAWMILTGFLITVSTRYINPYFQKVDGKNLNAASVVTFYILFGITILIVGIAYVLVGFFHAMMKKLVQIAKIAGFVIMGLFAIQFILAVSINGSTKDQMSTYCNSKSNTCTNELAYLIAHRCNGVTSIEECAKEFNLKTVIDLRKDKVQGWCATMAAVSFFIILLTASVIIINLGEEVKAEKPVAGSSAYSNTEVAQA